MRVQECSEAIVECREKYFESITECTEKVRSAVDSVKDGMWYANDVWSFAILFLLLGLFLGMGFIAIVHAISDKGEEYKLFRAELMSKEEEE